MGYFLAMENNKKPEWFELADNDQPASRPIKNAPKRSLAFILAGVLVLPMGAGFALLSHDDNSAVAAETINLTQDSPAAVSSFAAKPSSTITMPTATREEEGEEGDDDYRAPTFSITASSSPTASSSTSEAPVAKASVAKVPVAITPPGTSSASNELILPPTKKAGDDDDDDDNYKKKSDGKKSKKSEHDDEDGEDEEDDD
jgi:hypothetical protein